MFSLPIVRASGLECPSGETGLETVRVICYLLIVALGLGVGAVLGLIGALAAGLISVC